MSTNTGIGCHSGEPDQPFATRERSSRNSSATFASHSFRSKNQNGQTSGAGIQTISIPGVHVHVLLKPPEESIGTTARNLAFSFQTTPYDPFDILRSPPEPVMARQFSTPRRMSLSVTGQATPSSGRDPRWVDRILRD